MSLLGKRRQDSSVEDTAAEWVARKDAGLSAQEHADLEVWLKADPSHAEAYHRSKSVWIALDRPRATGSADRLLAQLRARQHRRRTVRQTIGGVAALAVLVGLGWWTRQKPPLPAISSTVVTHVADRQVLPDGSVVELDKGAKVEVDYSGHDRRVLLSRGEALFVVAKNRTRPFIVTARSVDVLAVGTAFAVQLSPKSVEILVTEGTVAVGGNETQAKAAGSPPPIFVSAGNRLVVPTQAQQPAAAATPVPASDMAKLLEWRSPRYEFSGAPLSEVVEILNQGSQTRIEIGDPSLKSILVSGSFRSNHTADFLQVLEAGFGITSERQSANSVILRPAP
jgi:transmembrane sensor